MTAFLLACTMNGIANGGIYLQTINHCIDYKDKLNQQTYMKEDKRQK